MHRSVVAGRLSMYLGYNVEYEDLVSYGVFGLIDAIDKFDPGKDVKFETYAAAYPRFHSGSDPQDGMGYQGLSDRSRSGLRKQSKISRRGRDVLRRMKRLLGRLELRAAEWQSQLKVTNVVSLNEFVEQGGEPVMDAPAILPFRTAGGQY